MMYLYKPDEVVQCSGFPAWRQFCCTLPPCSQVPIEALGYNQNIAQRTRHK